MLSAIRLHRHQSLWILVGTTQPGCQTQHRLHLDTLISGEIVYINGNSQYIFFIPTEETDMSFRQLTAGMTTTALLMSSSLAWANTTLDFESPLPVGLVAASFWQGSAVTAQNLIGDNYLSLGVAVSGAALVNLGSGHAASGINGLSGVSGSSGVDYGAAYSFEFLSPTNSAIPATTNYFSITPDLWGGSFNTVTLSAFDNSNQLIGSGSFVENVGSLGTLELNGIGAFHKVVVAVSLANPNSGGIGMDLVTFGDLTAIAPVPEPETYAMMLAGLGLLGLAAKRRRQKPRA